MNITNQIGQLTELKCQLDFFERGINLSQPINPSCRYDYIIDIEGKLYRIQCKTAHEESNNRISISIQSRNWNSGVRHSYVNEIDFFYTNWHNQGYLIPIDLCTKTNRQKFLRLGEPSDYSSNNNALYGIDYEIDTVLSQLNPNVNINRITIEQGAKAISESISQNIILNKQEKYCIDCGKPISKNATRCSECYNKLKHPLDMPSREELKHLIRTEPFTRIGEKYGRTDNTIRKWCDFIPFLAKNQIF